MSECRKKFKNDVSNAISLIQKYSWSFKDFCNEGEILSFCWCGKNSVHYTLCISDEYPKNSILTNMEDNTAEVVDRPVHNILQKLRSDILEQERDTLVPECKPTVDRLISNESDLSEYLDCNSGQETDDYDDYYGDSTRFEESDEEGIKIHPLLLKDIDQVKFLYGDKAVNYRLFVPIEEIDVELNIPISFLDREVANAWKLDRDCPLVVLLHLSSHDYLNYDATPGVEVFQGSKKEKSSVGIQMAKIMETFLLENWKKTSNSLVDSAVCKSVSVPVGLCHMTEKQSKALNDEVRDDDNDKMYVVDDHALSQIVDMGFSVDLARNSLIIARGDVQDALNFLVTNTDSHGDVEGIIEVHTDKKPEPAARQTSYPSFKRYKRQYKKQKSTSMVTSVTTPNLQSSAPVEDLTLLPSSTIKGLNSKNMPTLENGFLVQIFQYARQRIPTLNEYCVICDEPHVFQNGAMLKPAVCSRELCVFSYQTLNVMSDAAADIATGAEVVDLLVTMTKAACKHNRKATIFDPYPTVVDPKKSAEFALNPKSKDYDKVEQILKVIPDMNTISRFSGAELKSSLDDRNILAYPLLQWIIGSNRSHIVKLPLDRRILSMATPHQFLLLSSPPAKEAKFLSYKEKYGSTYAFHGSSIENWHSIIREGLIVASGTNKQMNGSAYGKGIYLSPSSSVSFGYSRMGYGAYDTKKNTIDQRKNSRFLTSQNITCIALCEVITSPDLKKNNDIWVAPNSDYVCTRFFFVYEDGQVGDNQINTQVAKYKKEIVNAVGEGSIFR
ncbi:hypothetical protein SNE40_011853 [Patella caerulea]|uniref:Poly [ADP-ribose] polymerase n=1 Tax=Patella caerulea TaxID=87958 RepID=A0AAN8PMA0_PATCE